MKSQTTLGLAGMFCATVLASVFMLTRGTSAPSVDPVPVVAEFSDVICETFEGTRAEANELVANYRAKQAVLRCDIKIDDTAELFDIYKLAAEFGYGKDHKQADKFPALYAFVAAELRAKNLFPQEDSTKPIPVDRDGIIAVFDQVIEGLE